MNETGQSEYRKLALPLLSIGIVGVAFLFAQYSLIAQTNHLRAVERDAVIGAMNKMAADNEAMNKATIEATKQLTAQIRRMNNNAQPPPTKAKSDP